MESVQKTKRIQALGWFLTYPRCLADKETLQRYLQCMKYYFGSVVCQETHEDGTLHLHAFVKYTNRTDWKSDRWDFDYEGTLYHGNYQAAKSFKAVEMYVKKSGNFIVDNIKLSTNFMGKSAKEILTMPPKDAIENDHISWYRYKDLVSCQYLYRIMNVEAYEHPTTRGVWIYGKPGTGKSHYARAFLKEKFGSFYIKSQAIWWDGYIDSKGILLDDFDAPKWGHELKIWLDKWGCNGEVKQSTVPLCHEIFMITSNYTPEDLWGNSQHGKVVAEAIRRRCSFIRFDEPRVPIFEDEHENPQY